MASRDGLRQRRSGGGGAGYNDDNGKRKAKVTLETFDLYTKVRDDEQQAPTTSGATGEEGAWWWAAARMRAPRASARGI